MKGRNIKKKGKAAAGPGSMLEAHRDLEISKKSIRQLLDLRRSLYSLDPRKAAELEEFREKAIEALNNLFEDEIRDAG